jgi:hypothetical protein
MKLDEIITADEKLRLAQLIFKNTFSQLAHGGLTPQPKVVTPVRPMSTKPVAKAPSSKFKAKTPKRAPMAPAPKPLPKSKPLAPSPQQIKNQQQKNQQDYAQAVKKTFNKDAAKMPKSLQPLPTSIMSPIGGDPELNKKVELAKRQGEQNRSSSSLSRFSM